MGYTQNDSIADARSPWLPPLVQADPDLVCSCSRRRGALWHAVIRLPPALGL